MRKRRLVVGQKTSRGSKKSRVAPIGRINSQMMKLKDWSVEVSLISRTHGSSRATESEKSFRLSQLESWQAGSGQDGKDTITLSKRYEPR